MKRLFHIFSFVLLLTCCSCAPIGEYPPQTLHIVSWGGIPANKADTLLTLAKECGFDTHLGALIFQGVGANALPYCLDGWAISKPAPLNRVANDKATVIKNMQNYMTSYEYTWTKPGTYDITFIGSNSSYRHATQQQKDMTVIIVE